MGADFKWLERRENCEFHTQLGRETSKLFFFSHFISFPFSIYKNSILFSFFFVFAICILSVCYYIHKPILSTGSLMESRLIIKPLKKMMMRKKASSSVFVCSFNLGFFLYI